MEGNVEGAALEFIQLQLLDKGGIVMVLIVLLSIIAAVIVIERLLYFRGRRSDEEKLLKRLANTLQRGYFDEALGVCEQFHNSLSTLIQVGIRHVRERRLSVRDLRDHLVEAASLEIPKDERFLSALGTIAHIAPLLGLLGTVTGNIRAFGVLGELGAITDPALLSRGISEALLTTAAGIIVSIPAIIFYNSLVSKVNHRIIRLENRASELATMLIDADQAPRSGRQVIQNGSDAATAVGGNGAVSGNGAVDASAPANGIGATNAAPVPSQAEAAQVSTAPPAHAAPAYAAAMPARVETVPMHQAAGAAPFQAAPAPRMEPVPNHFDVVPTHHPAAVPVATHAEAVPGQVGAVPGHAVAMPSHVEPVSSHLGAAPGSTVAAPNHVEAVPARVVAVPTTQVDAVPTRVMPVPTRVEAVPAT